MKRSTHKKAMRAALGVISGGRRRAGILTASALLGGAACVSDDSPTVVEPEDTTPAADVASGQIDGTSDGPGSGDITTPPADVAPTEDTAVADTTVGDSEPVDDATVADATPPEDTATPPEDTATPPEDTATPPKDTAAAEDTAVADASGPQPLEGTCLFATGQDCNGWYKTQESCATDADCAEVSWNPMVVAACVEGLCGWETCEEEFGMLACVDGACFQGQMGADDEISQLAEACCFEAYDDPEGFWVPEGCTPWGPPAPPAWDGRRLTRAMAMMS